MTTGQPGQDPNAQQPPWGQPQYPQQQYPQQPYLQQPYPQQPYPQQPHPEQQYPPGQYPPAAPPWGVRPMAPKPGTLALRPSDVGTTMSAAFGSIGNVLRVVWPGVVALAVCSGLLGLLLSFTLLVPARENALPSTRQWILAVALGLPLYLLQLAATMLMLFATVRATADGVLGRRSDVAGTWRTSIRGLPRAGTLFLFGVVVSLLVSGAVIGLIYLGYTDHWATFTLLLIVLVLVLLAAWLLVLLKLSLTIPAMLLEGDEQAGVGDPLDTRPAALFASIGRSWRLTSGRAWRTLLIVWLMWLIATAAVGVVSPILQVPLSLVSASHDVSVWVIATTVSSALGSALYVLPWLLTAITVTVLYVDARIRDEQLAPAIIGHLQQRVPANPWTDVPAAGGAGDAPWAGIGIRPDQPPDQPFGQSAIQPD